MITSIKTNNVSDYRALFEEASDILSGYNRVRTYDSDKEYFYRDQDATEADKLFVKDTAIKDLDSFAEELKKHNGILYVKRIDENTGAWAGVAEDFYPLPGITTIEEYFSWLKILGEINRKYTVLPLDEPHFEINSNTRAITIPADFKKNGVAVQGDDLAEVLYFKIDRYFDYMDLNNCDIFIQWETPKNAKGEIVKSASPAYIRDIESEPGKLIFGWILDDAITSTAGNLKFSVRFYQWGTNADGEQTKDLAYSFSTLTAQVAIHPSINFNPETDEVVTEDLGARLLGRIKASEIVGGYVAHVPVFLLDLIEDINGYDYGIEKKNAKGDIAFTGTKLRVVAKSPDTGSMSYSWRKQDLTGDKDYHVLENANEYIKVDDLNNLGEETDFWVMNGGVPNKLGHYPTETEIANGIELYKRVATCEIDANDITGIYWCVAENRMTNSSTTEESTKVEFPLPKDIVITKAPALKNNILVNDECDLTIIVEEADSSIQKKRYEWYYNDNANINFGKQPANFTGEIIGTDATLTATKEGHYMVKVFNKRNGVETELASDSIPVCRVTKAAQKAVIVEPANAADRMFDLIAISDNNCPTIRLSDTIPSDEYTIQWYHKEGTFDPILIETDIINPRETLICKFNPTSAENAAKIREGSLAQGGDGDLAGSYYPIIINNLNGSLSQTTVPDSADMFKVVD